MCALAFLDLPFVASEHSLALAAHTRTVEIARKEGSPVLIGQSYFRADDRYTWEGAEKREKYVTGEMLAGVVYRCQVVVTNPTSMEQKLDVLVQIPSGAVPVDKSFFTRTTSLRLSAYGTHSLEYAFYFPAPGRFTHFPAHVTKAGEYQVSAEARELEVVREPKSIDLGSWAHVSQHASTDQLLVYLAGANLGRIDLARIAWRMHDRDAFVRVTALLESRHIYADKLWAYALKHGDRARAGEWLRLQDWFPHEPVHYQHLEYAPLINARAHRLGAKRRILDSALDEQYRQFLDRLAHRERPSSDDLLEAVHYLLTMDRVDDALPVLARVEKRSRIQYDYLAAYVACYRGDLAAARALATPWGEHPVDRWRRRFAALVQMLDEIDAKSVTAIDRDNRDQVMTEQAARQPALELKASGSDIVIGHDNLAACQLRFFEMDIELLFSRQPFVQGDVQRFSFIEPGHVVEVALTGQQTIVPIPASLRGSNLVIEAVAPGARRAVAHYAHDLGVQIAHAYGQLRVVRASTGAPMPAVYIKVYGRERSGKVAFYKDGYTDLRGRWDYATLSTDDLDRVERFAILIASDDAGATIAETPPPAR
jgi:hypothetical protein